MEHYIWETAEEMDKKLAIRMKELRKRKGLSQEELSKQSGVSYGSVKRFETTGMISLLSLTKLAVVLGCAEDIRSIFSDVPYASIEEVIRENK